MRVLLHPVGGIVVLTVVMFLMFQAVFSWAKRLMDWHRGRHGRRSAAG